VGEEPNHATARKPGFPEIEPHIIVFCFKMLKCWGFLIIK
jgi:hypothetical protein